MNRSVLACVLAAGLATAAYAGTARLSPPGGETSADMPVIAADALARPGQTVVLEDLVAIGTRTTGLELVNLSGAAAQCTVSLTSAGGAALGEVATVSLAPRSHRHLAEVFEGLADATSVTGARAAVSCTREFYAFALISDRETGDVIVVDPSALSASASVTSCGGAVCFDADGLVHQPTKAKPVGRVAFAVPPGTYGRVRMSLDVTVGPWYAPDPDGKHLVYWFVLNRNLDMLGMLYFRGPNAYTALSRYGIGLTHPKKKKLVKPFQAVPGRTYHCENDLDMVRGLIEVTVTDTATGEAVLLRGFANVRQLTTRPGDRFIIDMAFPEGKVKDEVPSYDWRFEDVHIEAYPK
ncbi:MAG TPA: hypothetical protein VGG03_00760 [Thermoanaerobaculia bacterium]|jgi:hypothetical protein